MQHLPFSGIADIVWKELANPLSAESVRMGRPGLIWAGLRCARDLILLGVEEDLPATVPIGDFRLGKDGASGKGVNTECELSSEEPSSSIAGVTLLDFGSWSS